MTRSSVLALPEQYGVLLSILSTLVFYTMFSMFARFIYEICHIMKGELMEHEHNRYLAFRFYFLLTTFWLPPWFLFVVTATGARDHTTASCTKVRIRPGHELNSP